MRKGNSKSEGYILNLQTALIAAGIITIIIASMSIPTGNTNDIYVEFTIHQPLLGSPEITDTNVYAHPTTLIQAPALGSILTGGDVVVLAKTATKQGRANIGEIYRTDDNQGVVVIRAVPAAEKDLMIELYEDGKLIATKGVVLV